MYNKSDMSFDDFFKEFVGFLKKEKAYYKFKREMSKTLEEYDSHCYKKYLERRLDGEYSLPIDCLYTTEAFCLWCDSEQGYAYWAAIYFKWLIETYQKGYWEDDRIKEQSRIAEKVLNRSFEYDSHFTDRLDSNELDIIYNIIKYNKKY